MYFYLKAIHIIFVVTWFAALFYMPRLFVYDIECRTQPEPNKSILSQQFAIMQRRLWYGISWPSMFITLITGTWLVIDGGWDITKGWLLYKLIFVIALVIYHIWCQKIMMDMKKGLLKFTSTGMRIWNEIPTIMLFTIVFLVVLKNGMAMWKGLGALFILILVLMVGIKTYKWFRKNP